MQSVTLGNTLHHEDALQKGNVCALDVCTHTLIIAKAFPHFRGPCQKDAFIMLKEKAGDRDGRPLTLKGKLLLNVNTKIKDNVWRCPIYFVGTDSIEVLASCNLESHCVRWAGHGMLSWWGLCGSPRHFTQPSVQEASHKVALVWVARCRPERNPQQRHPRCKIHICATMVVWPSQPCCAIKLKPKLT
jgi:hypothetical protein